MQDEMKQDGIRAPEFSHVLQCTSCALEKVRSNRLLWQSLHGHVPPPTPHPPPTQTPHPPKPPTPLNPPPHPPSLRLVFLPNKHTTPKARFASPRLGASAFGARGLQGGLAQPRGAEALSGGSSPCGRGGAFWRGGGVGGEGGGVAWAGGLAKRSNPSLVPTFFFSVLFSVRGIIASCWGYDPLPELMDLSHFLERPF